MNTLISTLMSYVNGIFAILLVVVGTVFAYLRSTDVIGSQYEDGTAILGFLIGLSVAVVLCGFLALLITMRDALLEMRTEMKLSRQFLEKLSNSNGELEP